MPSVYLAGPINGCTDDECSGWRKEARLLLEPMHAVIDPMDFDCRGSEAGKSAEIVRRDLTAMGDAEFVLVNAERPSWGTAMEVVYASMAGKNVVAFCGASVASPWLRHHATKVCGSLFQACLEIENHAVTSQATRRERDRSAVTEPLTKEKRAEVSYGAEIDRLREAIRRLADQDATLSVVGGNVIVEMGDTLTDDERDAIQTAIGDDEAMHHHARAATLRGLLERLK